MEIVVDMHYLYAVKLKSLIVWNDAALCCSLTHCYLHTVTYPPMWHPSACSGSPHDALDLWVGVNVFVHDAAPCCCSCCCNLKKGGNGSSCAAESVQQRERWKTIYRARCAAQSAAQREWILGPAETRGRLVPKMEPKPESGSTQANEPRAARETDPWDSRSDRVAQPKLMSLLRQLTNENYLWDSLRL